MPDCLGLNYIGHILAQGGPRQFVWTTSKQDVQRELPAWTTGEILGYASSHDLPTPEGAPDYEPTAEIVEDEIPPEDGEEARPTPDDVGTFAAKALDRLTKQKTTEAQTALASGDKAGYDRLQLEIIKVREYKSQTIGLHGRRRKFATQTSRDFDAVRKAIDRAVQAIGKRSPKIADHLKAHICGSDGMWFYTGDLQWDTTSRVAEWSDWTPDTIEEDPQVLRIRRAWLRGDDKQARPIQRAILDAWKDEHMEQLSPAEMIIQKYRALLAFGYSEADANRRAREETYQELRERIEAAHRKANGIGYWW